MPLFEASSSAQEMFWQTGSWFPALQWRSSMPVQTLGPRSTNAPPPDKVGGGQEAEVTTNDDLGVSPEMEHA